VSAGTPSVILRDETGFGGLAQKNRILTSPEPRPGPKEGMGNGKGETARLFSSRTGMAMQNRRQDGFFRPSGAEPDFAGIRTHSSRYGLWSCARFAG